VLQCEEFACAVALTQREVAGCLEKTSGVVPVALVKTKHSQRVWNRGRFNANVPGASSCLQRERLGLPQVSLQQGQTPRRFGHGDDLLFRVGASRHRFCPENVPFGV